jgi:hypothetical protein
MGQWSRCVGAGEFHVGVDTLSIADNRKGNTFPDADFFAIWLSYRF